MNFLSKNSNEIAKITVSIENNKQSEKGTGFIVKQNNEDTMAYLFTAKHVFTGSKQNLTNKYTNNLPQKIYFDKKDIQIKLRKKEIFIENNEVFYLSSDIAFAFINLVENSIENIKCVKISDHDFFNKFCGFYAFGYPNTVSEDYGQVLELEFTREAETSLHKSNEEEIPTHTFKELVFSSKRNLGSFKKPGCPTNISDTLGGLSGGGIFLNKESDFLHINSIIIKSDGFTSIIALNLLEEIENINNLVEKECKSDNSIHPLLQINQIFEFDDNIPFGHGEKSVYMIQPFMRITREEAFAIRYHMGFSGSDPVNNVGKAFEMFPLAFALSTADMEATYFLDEQV